MILAFFYEEGKGIGYNHFNNQKEMHEFMNANDLKLLSVEYKNR